MVNAIFHKYFKEVKRNIPCFTAEKKKFLGDFQESLNAFSQENPDAGWEDLVNRFGAPEEIAVSFLPESGSGEVLKATRKKRLTVRLVLAFFALALTVLVALTAFYVQDKHYFYHGHYEDTITEGHLPGYSDALGVY